MRRFFKGNKGFLIFILLFIFSATIFRISTLKKKDISDKDVVSLVLQKGDLSEGIKGKVDEFNSTNKEIFIDLEEYAEDYRNVVTNKLANENKIDIFVYLGKNELEKEFIKPLEDGDIDTSQIPSGSILSFNDKPYGVKYGSSTPKLMFNKDLLEELNLSVDKEPSLSNFLEVCRTIKTKKGITPFQISLDNIHDLFSFIGSIAAYDGEIYPTFWNYEQGKYDYSKADKIVETLRIMYKEGLINEDFSTASDKSIMDRFENKEAGIIFTNYFFKNKIIEKTENMNVTFTELPTLYSDKDIDRYYYTYSSTLVIANKGLYEVETQKHENSVKEVYNWLLSKEIVNYLVENNYNFSTFSDNINNFNGYNYLNFDENYKELYKDPTEVLAGDSSIIRNGISSIITGENSVQDELEKLTSKYNEYISNNKRNEDVNLDKYREK